MNSSFPSSVLQDDRAFDVRWAQWLAAGALADRRLRRRMLAIAVVIGCGFGAWLAAIVRIA